MRGLRFAAFAAIFLVAACSTELDRTNSYDLKTDPSEQAEVELSGVVTLEGEADHSNIEILLRGPTKTDISTDASGAFVVNELTPGEYEISMNYRGFSVLSDVLDVSPGQVLDLGSFELAVSRAVVSGQLQAEDAAVSLAGASITLDRIESARGDEASGAPFAAMASTGTGFDTFAQQSFVGPDGAYIFRDVPVGLYSVVIQQENAGTVTIQVRVGVDGADVSVEPVSLASISGDFSIEGTLVDGSKSAVLTAQQDVKITLVSSGVKQMKVGQTDGEDTCVYGAVESFASTKNVTLDAGDGTRTICVQLLDATGNVADELRSSIVLDTTAPDFSILRINGGNDYTTDSQAIIEVLGIDATSGMDGIEVVRNGGTAAVYDYLPAISDPLTGQGQFDYDIVLIDRAGHRSAQRSGSVIRDSIAPQGVTYTVGNGSAQVPAGPVTVTVGWTDDGGSDLQMKLWLQSEGTASFVPITTQTTIEIPSASGTYNIGLVVRDAAGNEVDIGPVAVTVDFTPPESPEIALAGGAAYSTTTVVAISTLQAVDDSEVRVSESPTLSGATWTASYPANYSFTGADGVKTLYAQFRDDAGNESEIVSAQIIVDTTAPEIAAFTLNSGAAYNTDPAGQFNVYLASIDINGVTHMRIDSGTSCNASGAGTTTINNNFVHTYANAGAGVEETAYVCVQVRDGAGNWSAEASASVQYDTQAPSLGTPSITVAGGAAATNETVVTVALDATGADEMQLSQNSGFAGSGWLSYTTSTLFTLDSANGTKTVYVRFRDAAGNTVDDSDSVVLDVSGPGTPLVTLAGSSESSTSRTVAVALSNSADASQMLLSDSAAFSGASWETFSAATSYTFGSDGIATLYVMYRDAVGNQSAVGSDSVVIDTGVPGAGQILIDSGLAYSTDTALTLTLFSSGADEMRFAEDANMLGASSWQAYSTSYAYTITTAGEGTKTVYAQFKDTAGNVSDVVSDDIIYDGTAPDTGAGIQIASGVTYTTNAQVTVSLDIPSDATEMIIADNTGFAGSSWQSTDTEVSWNLGSSDGTKTLYAKWRDAAGNETGLQSDDIELDTEPPAPGSNAIVINNGNTYSNATDTVGVTFDAVGAVWMAVSSSQDFDSPEYYGAYGVSADIPVPVTDGSYELYVVFADAAGNLSSVRSDTIVLDRTAPELSDAILNDESRWLQTQNARVQLFGYDENLLTTVHVSNGLVTQSVPYVPSFVVDTGLAEGESGQFTVAIEDAAGNVSTSLTSQIVTRDSTPPTPGAIPIQVHGDAMYTNERFVDLEIDYGDAAELRLSNNPGFTGSFWQDVTDYEAWNLSSGDGEKRVFVQFRDQAGNVTVPFSDRITLDTRGPQSPQVLLGLNGLYTNERVIDVDLIAQDSYRYEISTDIGFGSPVSGPMIADFAAGQITLPSTDGFYTVYAEFEDQAGNRSALAQDTIILDRTRPEVYDLVLQSPDNYFSKDQWVRFNLDAWDDNPMTYALIDTTATFSGSASEETNVQGDIWFYVPVTGQEVTIYIKAYDIADNESTVTSTTIFVDVTAPTADIAVVGPATVNSREIWLEFSNDSDDIVEYQMNEIGAPGPNAWKVYDGYHSLTLEDSEGQHDIFVWLRDWAGNESMPYVVQVTLDTQAPTLVGFTIDEAAITSATDWDVSVTGTTWSYAEVAEDPGFIDSEWFTGTTTSYDVSHKGDGRIALFARLCDDAGNCGNFLQASADLDTDEPYIDGINGAFSIREGEYATEITIGLDSTASGASQMQVREGESCGGPWIPYQDQLDYTTEYLTGVTTVFTPVSGVFIDGSFESAATFAAQWDVTGVALQVPVAPFAHAGVTFVAIALDGMLSTINYASYAATSQTYSYWYNGYSGASGVDPDDYLRVMYHDGTTWHEIARHLGSDNPLDVYVQYTGSLPSTAVAFGFDVSSGTDEYFFVDDVYLSGITIAAANIVTSYVDGNSYLSVSNEGEHTISVRYRDNAGNMTDCFTQYVTVDTQAPGFSAEMTGTEGVVGTTAQLQTWISLSDLDNDAVEMSISTNSGFAGAYWEPLQSLFTYQLVPGDGYKAVYIKVRDTAGNESNPAPLSIILDTIPPDSVAIALQDLDGDGFPITRATAEMSWTGSGDPFLLDYELQRYVVGVDNGFQPIPGTYTTAVTYADDITETAGVMHQYRVRARDVFGQVSQWSNILSVNTMSDDVQVCWATDQVVGSFATISASPPAGAISVQQTFGFTDLETGNDSEVGYSINTLDFDMQFEVFESALDPYVNVISSNLDSLYRQSSTFRLPMGIEREILDDQSAGAGVVVVVDASGYVHMAYVGNGELKYVNNVGGSWNPIETIDTEWSVGYHVDIALDSNGYAHISYWHRAADDLRYATNKSGSWTYTTLDASGYTGTYSSIAVDGNDDVHISYFNDDTNHLLYIRQNAGVWGGVTGVDTSGDAGGETNLEIDSSGQAHITYLNVTNFDLMYVKTTAGVWGAPVVIDGSGGNPSGQYSDMTIDANDNLHVSVYGYWSVRYLTNAGGSWNAETIDAPGKPNCCQTSIAVDRFGIPYVAYGDGDDLVYAERSSGTWSVPVTMDAENSIYDGTSIGVDKEGGITFAYRDDTLSTLKYMRINPGWNPQLTLYTAGFVGSGSAVELEDDGDAHIAFVGQNELQYVWSVQGTWQSAVTLDTDGPDWRSLDSEIDSVGDQHLTYHIGFPDEVRYLKRTSSGWSAPDTVVSLANGPNASAMALDSNDKVHISYVVWDGVSTYELYYVHNVSGSWSAPVLLDTNDSLSFTQVVVDSNDDVHVLYAIAWPDYHIQHKTNAGGSWSAAQVAHTIGWSGPLYFSAEIDAADVIHIAAQNNNNELVYTNNLSGWNSAVIETGYQVNYELDLKVSGVNDLHISFYDFTDENLRYISRTDMTWNSSIVMDGDNDVGRFSSIAVDANGLPHIAYKDETNSDLKYKRVAPQEFGCVDPDNIIAVGPY